MRWCFTRYFKPTSRAKLTDSSAAFGTTGSLLNANTVTLRLCHPEVRGINTGSLGYGNGFDLCLTDFHTPVTTACMGRPNFKAV